MPNWCHNKLTVTGPDEDVDEFVVLAKSDRSPLDFYRFIPEPPTISERREQQQLAAMRAMSDETYAWQKRHFGVKWGSCDVQVVETSPGLAVYQFDTPWGPADTWLEEAAAQFPALVFTLCWSEAGCCTAGLFVGVAGAVTHREADFKTKAPEWFPETWECA